MNINQRILRRFVLGFYACLFVIGLSSFAAFGQPSETRYLLTLNPDQVMPKAPSSTAKGEAMAKLKGNRLTIKGEVQDLSSPLRDYTTDPANPPNPSITSGVHVHRGERMENGPFQFALGVKVRDSGSLRFRGEYTLSEEQLQALKSGGLYVDVHTQQNRTGELRGVFQPV
jgi:hypothetical protein